MEMEGEIRMSYDRTQGEETKRNVQDERLGEMRSIFKGERKEKKTWWEITGEGCDSGC